MTRKKITEKKLSSGQQFQPDFLIAESKSYYGKGELPKLILRDDAHGIYLYQGDSLILLEQLHHKYPDGIFDLIFADPPYFLSNNGITCHAGKMVSVNKGDWDRLKSVDQMHAFNKAWLAACQKALRENGSIFVSETHNIIHWILFVLEQSGRETLNATRGFRKAVAA